MAIYSVYLPPEATGPDNLLDSDRARIAFLADGKSVLALVVPLIWLIWQRLWLPLAIYFLVVTVIITVTQFLSPQLGLVLSVLPGFFLFLEGRELIRRRYERQGWHFDGVIEAPDEISAETRYFSNHELNPAQSINAVNSNFRLQRPVLPRTVPAMGLFPE